MKEKIPEEIKEVILPVDTFKNAKLTYNYKKRTNGGFIDAIFLSAIILTSFLWIILLIKVER